MRAFRYLGVVGLAAIAAALMTPACGEESETGGGGSTSSNGTGGVSSTSTSSSGTGGSGGIPLLTCTEAYTSITDGACDLLNPLSSCDTGFWCDVQGSTSACVTVQGKGVKGPGQPCAGDTECAAGLSCQMNKCSPVCCPADNQPCSENSGECNIEVTISGDQWVQMCSYLPACTLLQDTCENDGDVCIIQDGDQCLSVCVGQSGSAVPEGGECNYLNDCSESQHCNSEGGVGICRQLCNVNSWQTDEVPLGGCPPNRDCTTKNTGCSEWSHIGMCMPNGSGGAGGAGGSG